MLLFYLDTNQPTKHAYISRWRFIQIGYKKGVVKISAFIWALGTHANHTCKINRGKGYLLQCGKMSAARSFRSAFCASQLEVFVLQIGLISLIFRWQRNRKRLLAINCTKQINVIFRAEGRQFWFAFFLNCCLPSKTPACWKFGSNSSFISAGSPLCLQRASHQGTTK